MGIFIYFCPLNQKQLNNYEVIRYLCIGSFCKLTCLSEEVSSFS